MRPETETLLKDPKGIFAMLIVSILIFSILAIILLQPTSPIADGAGEEDWISAGRSPPIPMKDSDVRMDEQTGEWRSAPDKLPDIVENYIFGTNASNPDTDGDGMEDGWEAFYSRIDPRSERLVIDPNRADAWENPDGDGLDSNHNGILDGDENLTNIEEYLGQMRSQELELELGFELDRDNVENDPHHLEIIAKMGGFHLYEDYDTYIPNDPFYPEMTTDPTNADSDGDGMDDGFEFYYRRVCTTLSFEFRGEYNYTFDPLDPADAKMDIDVRKVGERQPGIIFPDDLTNLEEYQNHTDPTLYDTDGDSFKIVGTNEWQYLSDQIELQIEVKDSNTDWTGDGVLDHYMNPNDPDTDGDMMDDGWEHYYGLSALNSSDRFLDLDGDGLPNYLEYRFPELGDIWFRTNPNKWDTDSDGMPDGWETRHAKIMYVTYDVVEGTEEDLQDGLDNGIHRAFTVNPMVWDADADNDGIQYPTGTDPNNPDTDGDWLSDGEELGYVKSGIAMGGFSGQLINDIYYTSPSIAARYYTNASTPDSDFDFDSYNLSRVLDDWEETHGMQKSLVNNLDDDGDGTADDGRMADNGIGYVIQPIGTPEGLAFKKTNATNPDTDLDGLNDVDEIFGVETTPYVEDDPTSGFGLVRSDPTNKDSDSDGLSDSYELNGDGRPIAGWRPYLTNPNDADSDDDQLEDGQEEETDYYPFMDFDPDDNLDLNGDGDYDDLVDIISSKDNSNPRKPDSDGDHIPDGWEHSWGFADRVEDLDLIVYWDDVKGTSNAKGLQDNPFVLGVWLINPLDASDRYEDPDRDGLVNWDEYKNNTDPLDPDTDHDGLPDSWEIEHRKLIKYYDKNGAERIGFDMNPLKADSNENDILDDEDGDGNFQPNEEIMDRLDNDGDVRIDEEFDLNDGNEDNDDDGVYYRMYTPNGTSWELRIYYHPFSNHMEYDFGFDGPDADILNEHTTDPNHRDSDLDGMPDGWELWFSDRTSNSPNLPPDYVGHFEDNDNIAAGWEMLFNGSTPIFPTDYYPRGLIEHPEIFMGQFDPNKFDTDGDGIPDTDEDPDDDGYTNQQEYANFTDPTWALSNPSTVHASGGGGRAREGAGDDMNEGVAEKNDGMDAGLNIIDGPLDTEKDDLQVCELRATLSSVRKRNNIR